MAIDPPYRLDPFRNIINVHWMEEQTGPPSPPTSYNYVLLTQVGVNYNAGFGSGAVRNLTDRTTINTYSGTIENPSIGGTIGCTISGSTGFSAGGYTGFGTSITAGATGTGVSWQVSGESLVGISSWAENYAGLTITITGGPDQGRIIGASSTWVGPLSNGGPGDVANYYFGVRVFCQAND